MFKALARFFGLFSKPKAKPRPPAKAPAWTPSNFGSRPILDPAETIAAMEHADPAPSARPGGEEARAAAEQRVALDINASPESLCGITPDMSRAEISDLLARLYQRHNRASSSFDVQLASEAEFMLDIIAGMREKYLSRPPGE